MRREDAFLGAKVVVPGGVEGVIIRCETTNALIELSARHKVLLPYERFSLKGYDMPQGAFGKIVDERFPHRCPYCSCEAYVTDFSIDHNPNFASHCAR